MKNINLLVSLALALLITGSNGQDDGVLPFVGCPLVACLQPECSDDLRIPGFLNVNGPDGQPCPGCQKCADVCPFIKCADATNCPEDQKFRNIVGEFEDNECLGCLQCPETTTTTEPSSIPGPCPLVRCAPPPCDISVAVQGFLDTIGPDGEKCPGCKKCPDVTTTTEKPTCPKFLCKTLVCNDGFLIPNYERINGQRCRGCDTCFRWSFGGYYG